MVLPKQTEIEIPLLKAIKNLGGEAKAKHIYPLVTQEFSDITEADLATTLQSGRLKWKNRIQWVRQTLINCGQIESGGHGVWRITAKGLERIENIPSETKFPNGQGIQHFEDLWDSYETAFRQKTLHRLHSLSPEEFEIFGGEFLRVYGFSELELTAKGADGGIDGHGKLKVGLATMKVAFQCKRWKGKIPRPEIDKFRGAIQGQFQQGVFFTTSDFTTNARGASIKAGAVPVILFNGDELVQIMIERNFGIARRPLFLFEEAPIPGIQDADW
jgi:restriction system protein